MVLVLEVLPPLLSTRWAEDAVSFGTDDTLIIGLRAPFAWTVLAFVLLVVGINGRIGPLVALPGRVSKGVAPLGELVGRGWGADFFTPASVDSLLNHPVVDHTKATRELGYVPRPRVDTVRDLVTWLGQDGQLDRRRRCRARDGAVRDLPVSRRP